MPFKFQLGSKVVPVNNKQAPQSEVVGILLDGYIRIRRTDNTFQTVHEEAYERYDKNKNV